MTPEQGSCTSTDSTNSTCRADEEYTIDIEKEVDKLIEDPSRPSRRRPRKVEKRRDGQPLSFLHGPTHSDKGTSSVSAGLAAYRARGLATLQAIEMHDRPGQEWEASETGLSAYRAHGLATLQAMEASGYENRPWPQVYSAGWCNGGRAEAPTFYAAEWMPPPGTAAVFVPGPAMVPQASWGQAMREAGNGCNGCSGCHMQR